MKTDFRKLILDSHYNSVHEAIVAASDDAIISHDLNGKISNCNNGAIQMFGYSLPEMKGKNVADLIPDERKLERQMIGENIKKGEKLFHFDTIRITKSGTEKYVLLTLLPIFDNENNLIGATQIFRDMSFRRLADEKQATLAAIVSSSDDAIVSKTLNGIITSWNGAATSLFGYQEEEVLGKHISIIIPKERIEEETVIINNIRAGKKVDHFETVRVAKDGTERYISLTVSPIKSSDGRIIGASKVARDISVRVEAEKQRKLFIERLQELNDYKDEFMVMASHELKTPLTVISANLQVLKQMLDKHATVPIVEKVINKVFKMSELISNLLDVSKIQAGKLELSRSDFDFVKVIRDVANNLQETTKVHDLKFNPQENALEIFADQERIEHVIMNLIGNAIKYSPDGGDILIAAGTDGGQIWFSVSDEGIGIPENDLENIFQRFYRVRGSASSFAGSGIGLYLSAEIVKKHGGSIKAESIENKGTTLKFSIPANAK